MNRPIAWHIGRRGEVAGGMTQVVNGYLAWSFDRFDVRVLVSRDGSHGPRALALFARAAARLATLGGRRTDVIVAHLSQGGSFLREGVLLRLARARGFATVAQLHGSSFRDFADRRPDLVRRVLSAASVVLTLSDESADVARRFVPADRVVLLPNAVPHGDEAPKGRTVVFGGSVSHRKGVDVLVRAWRAVGAGSGWRLLIAGPVADEAVVDRDLPDAEFLGSVEHAHLMHLLESSSVAVLPSRDEAMPMFILEALARRNCVIATRVGGIASVLDEGRGLLVDPGDVEQLEQALRTALFDDHARERIAAAGAASFDAEFSARAVYPRVEQVWSDALASR
ncbi:glycosyltransferase involved in cell wall biosynthesis [Diaminobutyricimonas aerilata]|uniref:D-inositol 3-phosphate glycosyltransferase n=1 Tax=Diaminobutyricimonas aerilata TaxID=1162967 RepID=A0A2M9CIX9_9MICO|nr:glycosyltransferase family 4 protein [Diaminobutyricimonas aerilata]PJJ71844.1 glycosyltransferase involved in cell wall biosynthesis [Diaminobutyricimonas aerilata]